MVLIGQFLHDNWSIKIEITAHLDVFYRFSNMLLRPDPRPFTPDPFDNQGEKQKEGYAFDKPGTYR